jgi:hypothetical protein
VSRGFFTGGGATASDIWGYGDRRLTLAPVLKRYCWSGADGDASFTPTTATTYNFPRPIMFYRNLVIGSLATLKPPSGQRVQILCVSGTLQLDGVIDVSGLGGAGGAGAAGGGGGGAGGGGIIVIARRIIRSGEILANGLRGANASAPSGGAGGSAGSSGAYRGYTISAGAGGSYCIASTTGSGGGGAGVWGNGGRGPCGCCGSGGTSSKHISFLIPDIDIPTFIPSDGYGAGGGGGGGDTTYFTVAGGGGGGGGGLIVVMSNDVIPGITLSARGGDGGNTYNYVSYGGGGGGGLIIVVAPADNSVKDVSGGATGGGGTPGETGLIRFISAYAYEVI